VSVQLIKWVWVLQVLPNLHATYIIGLNKIGGMYFLPSTTYKTVKFRKEKCMDWLIWVSLGALFIGIWHEVNRFPATNESFLKIHERLEELESENQNLSEKVETLDDEVLSLSNEIDKIKNFKIECRKV
jgi:uncharacterized protein YlxW (UPF0749 family)